MAGQDKRMGGTSIMALKNGLTLKQHKFCREYLVDGCGKDAYLRAGYAKTKGTKQNAYSLLTKPEIKAEIERLLNEMDIKAKITREYILEHLDSVANDPQANAADKLRALDLMGKWRAMWTERVQQVAVQAGPPEDPKARIAWHKEQIAVIEGCLDAGNALVC
jgi:phage terminase small subunit